MEPDSWYYRRRACEEVLAASRAVTDAARDRRLRLVKAYLDRLQALGEPWPFPENQIGTLELERSAFGWRSQ